MPIIAETGKKTLSSRPVRSLSGLWEVAGGYEGFIVDLWGVVHDGHSPYPCAAETFRRLREQGCRVALLSNAPRRSQVLIDQLEGFGIPESSYSFALSSGDCVRTELIERTDPAFAGLGDACYFLGPERNLSLFDDVPVRLVGLEEATFFVNAGPYELEDSLESYTGELTAARDRGLPMVCANPDRAVIRQGQRLICAGALADRYAEMGGHVVWRGKPDPAIYRLCVRMMGCDASKIAVIGDGLETDMRGARNAGLDGIWVTGGVHAKELGTSYGKPADPASLARVAADYGESPLLAIPGFIW